MDTYHAKGVLQGKVSGDFRQIKWKFIFEILVEMQQMTFNKKHFVTRTLQQMAAHYNLSFDELLSYFAVEPDVFANSEFAETNRIIRELYAEEKIQIAFFTENKTLVDIVKKLPSAFIRYISAILRDLPAWCRQYTEKYEKKPDYKGLEILLRELVKNYQSLSLNDIIRQIKRVIVDNDSQSPSTSEDSHFRRNDKNIETEKEIENPETFNIINNAGMVLLSPYLPRLFSILELTEEGKFKDRKTQIRAIFLIQYAVCGTNTCHSALDAESSVFPEYPEYALTLNKLLTGFRTSNPIPRMVELTEKETTTVDSLLQGVLANWEKLKKTSVAGLREGFLQREGKLEERENVYHLIVEEKAYDMLLDSCPWSFKTIKFSWMKKGIEVKWR